MELSEFEKRILDALVETNGSQEALLREQLSAVTDLGRDFTGVGYYLNFSVPSSVPKLSLGSYPVGDVRFELEGIKDGGCALLWIEDGCLACLEVSLHSDEKWPAEPRITQLEKLSA